MTSRIGRSIILGTFLGSLVASLIWFTGYHHIHFKTKGPPVQSIGISQQEPVPDFKITILQTAGESNSVLNCDNNQCRNMPTAPDSASFSITDTRSWFYYRTIAGGKNKIETKQLVRTSLDRQRTDIITEQTPLTKPRGLFISPDNKKIAFWLDNTHDKKSNLTELWTYDADEQGIKLLAENIVVGSVLSQPRWNKASTHLWFVGDTSLPGQKARPELHIVSTKPTGIATRFTNANWNKLLKIANAGTMDINMTGRSIAYGLPERGKTQLVVQHEDTAPTTAKISGNIPYLSWLSDSSLIYAVQRNSSFTLWQFQSTIHKYLARFEGILLSAKSDPSDRYTVIITKSNANITSAQVLDNQTRQVKNLGNLPQPSRRTYLLQVEPIVTGAQPGQIGDRLKDDQIAAFIDEHLSDIVDEPAQPKKILITDQPNTIYIDYQAPNKSNHRLLITIRDAIHPEWSISAIFEEKGSEWVKIRGGGLTEPKILRLYEWEKEINQWILKENYE